MIYTTWGIGLWLIVWWAFYNIPKEYDRNDEDEVQE
jgi:hypothetical protein